MLFRESESIFWQPALTLITVRHDSVYTVARAMNETLRPILKKNWHCWLRRHETRRANLWVSQFKAKRACLHTG